ncbi:MAG: addiction module protein [Deltaproteobacteria bacterium]|jgi:Putative addiction module component
MAKKLDHIYEEAMSLPDETKAVLADRIVEYLVTHINPDLENFQLDIVKRRRDEIRQKKVEPVNGPDALAMARRVISK